MRGCVDLGAGGEVVEGVGVVGGAEGGEVVAYSAGGVVGLVYCVVTHV